MLARTQSMMVSSSFAAAEAEGKLNISLKEVEGYRRAIKSLQSEVDLLKSRQTLLSPDDGRPNEREQRVIYLKQGDSFLLND